MKLKCLGPNAANEGEIEQIKRVRDNNLPGYLVILREHLCKSNAAVEHRCQQRLCE